MKILIPISFTKASFSAFYYGLQLAQVSDAQVTVLHIVNGSLSTHEMYIDYYGQMLVDNAEKQVSYFTETYAKEQDIELPNIDFDTKVITGAPGFSIASFADDHDFDLIIMGTMDKHSVMARLLGSTTSNTIHEAPCPVLLIHENTRFNVPQKAVFAIDDEGEMEDALESYYDFNKKWRAYTEFIHVNEKKINNLVATEEEIVEHLFEDHDPAFSFEIKAISGKSTKQDIMDYCLFAKADLLVMMHREKSIIHRIFNGSMSIKLGHDFHLPVLIIPED